jgi:hypothetical protein
MFTHIQKVDRGLQASSVAAKILKQKWLAGLVPLEKTLASPPVTRSLEQIHSTQRPDGLNKTLA